MFKDELHTQITVSVLITYVFFCIALIITVIIFGIDLTRLTMVVGALSVGLGFGLQHVAADFVGGLIFHKRVKTLMEDLDPGEDVLIDLNRLHIDSSMIGTLLALHTTCRKNNRCFKIMNVSEDALKVLKLSGLHNVLEIVDLKDQQSK